MCKIKKFQNRADKEEIRNAAKNFIEATGERFTVQGFYNLLVDHWPHTERPPSYSTIAIKLDPANTATVAQPELTKWALILKPVADKFGIDWKEAMFHPNRSIELQGGGVIKFFPGDDTRDMTTAEVIKERKKLMLDYLAFVEKHDIDNPNTDINSLPTDVADMWAKLEYLVNGFGSLALSHCPGNLVAAKAYKDAKVGTMKIIKD